MGKIVKWLLLGLAGLFLLLGIAAGVLIAVVDDDTIKTQLARVVKDNTGGDLAINGDLGLSIFPKLGVSVEELQFTPPRESAPLAAIGTLRLGVGLLPLLQGQLAVDEITLDGLKLNLIRGKNGTGNWEKIETPDSATAEVTETPGEKTGGTEFGAMNLAISKVAITDTQVNYRDLKSGESYQLADLSLTSQDVNLTGGSFPADIGFTINTTAPRLTVRAQLSTQLSGDLDAQRLQLTQTQAVIEFTGEPTKDQTLSTQIGADADIDLAAGTAQLDNFTLALADLKIAGELLVSQLTSNPQATGKLTSEAFNPRQLMAALPVEAPAFKNNKSLTHAQFSADLTYTGKSAKLSNFTAELDNSKIKGKAGISDLSKTALFVNVAIDQLNVDEYALVGEGDTTTPTGPGTAKSAKGASTGNETLLPVDTLKSLNMDATLDIGHLIAAGATLTDVKLQASAHNGVLKLPRLAAALYGGSTAFNAVVDVKPKQPTWQFNGEIKGVQMKPLLKDTGEIDWLSGKANFNGQLRTSGNDLLALKRNVQGPASFSVTDGVIHETNLEKMVCQAIAAVNRQSLSQSWGPDTKLENIEGKLKFGGGKVENTGLTAGLSNTKLKGSGSVHLLDNTVDYRLGIRVEGTMREVDPACEVNKRYKDIYWPLRCAGSLDEEPSKLCGVDQEGMNDVIQKMAEEELRTRATDAAEDALKRLFNR